MGSAAFGGDIFDIQEIRFDPAAKGKNAVEVKVLNRSDQSRLFGVHIYSVALIGPGDVGRGWGTNFFAELEPGEEKWCRFPFRIQAEVEDDTYVKLRFYAPESRDGFDSEQYFQEATVSGGELDRLDALLGTADPAPAQLADDILNRFTGFQSSLERGEYAGAWETFSEEYRQAEYFGEYDSFAKKVKQSWLPYGWIQADFLQLVPQEVIHRDSLAVLRASLDGAPWQILFVREDGRWKVDWIGGYVDGPVQWANWMGRLLPVMEKRVTPHYDIYYEEGSTAGSRMDEIAELRESGYERIAHLLDYGGEARISLIFFEDFETKVMETGHAGGGWAFDRIMVEVYNEERQGDPHHETVHVLAAERGNPPAMLNEGLAVYMSEQLGNPALRTLGGETATVYERVRGLEQQGDWIPLEELLTYGNIGSNRAEVEYAEAGAFVKFLVEQYGLETFFEIYGSLQRSDDEAVQSQNRERLEQITGRSLGELDREWRLVFSGQGSTAVMEGYVAAAPRGFSLEQNYPNPFNGETVIHFVLPREERVELELYDLAGQKVATLVEGMRKAGVHAAHWDARDGRGNELASGPYFYRLRTAAGIATRGMTLLR